MKITLVILFALTLSSCMVEVIQKPISDETHLYDSFIMSSNEFGHWINVFGYILCNVKYVDDIQNYGYDYFASPSEVLSRKSGDCEDMSILFMYIMKKRYNVETELVIARYFEGRHAYVKAYMPEGIMYFDIAFNHYGNQPYEGLVTQYVLSYNQL